MRPCRWVCDSPTCPPPTPSPVPSAPPPTPLHQLQHGTQDPGGKGAWLCPPQLPVGCTGEVPESPCLKRPSGLATPFLHMLGFPLIRAHVLTLILKLDCCVQDTVVWCLMDPSVSPLPHPVNKSLVRVSLSRARMTSPSFPNHCPPGPPSISGPLSGSNFFPSEESLLTC